MSWNPLRELWHFWANEFVSKDHMDYLDHESEMGEQALAEWLGLVNEDCSCCEVDDFISKRTLGYTDDGDVCCSCVCHKEVKK